MNLFHMAKQVCVLFALLGIGANLIACSSGDTETEPNRQPDDGPAIVQLGAAASRTSGVAPLGVFFNAAIDTTTNDFHDLEYAWDFVDAAGKTWADSGASKNRDKGPVAAHVFESPGDYTVTLTVGDTNGVVATQEFVISVEDPDAYYVATDTICISNSGIFNGCPDGADHITLADIDELPNHVSSGKRLLLRRGDTWSTDGSAYYSNIPGPVTIGAFGACQNPDQRGICANAPRIDMSGDIDEGLFSIDRISDWRIHDLYITGETSRWGAIGGNTDIRSLLLLRMKVEGFNVPLGCSHWDTDGHDQFMIVDCHVSAAAMNEVYIGSERLVLMGNDFRNPGASHVLRVWQAYFGVIGHNTLSGSSQNSDAGRHALKFHGPGQAELGNAGDGQGGLVHPTRFVVIGGNVFGGSGPWPVAIGPQDSSHDERLRDIIVEKNRFFPGYGDQSCCSSPVQVALMIWARQITVRNNIFNGNDSSAYYTAVSIGQRGQELPSDNVRIFNNTIYKSDLLTGYTSCRGIAVGTEATRTIIQNNLVHLPAASEVEMISNASGDLVSDHNLMTDAPGLADPDNSDHLQKDFSLLAGSPAENQGADVPVWDDYTGTARPRNNQYDIGAFER